MAKIITVFLSMTGQTWADGEVIDLKKGFTKIAAEYIQEAVGGELFQIEQTRSYSKDHFTMIDEAKEEYQKKERPAIKAFCDNLEEYDTIFLGFPNWWGTVPMPVLTFLEHYDWNGKRIIPFVTSGGSGFGNALKDIALSAKGTQIDSNGLEIKGTKVPQSKALIQKWAAEKI